MPVSFNTPPTYRTLTEKFPYTVPLITAVTLAHGATTLLIFKMPLTSFYLFYNEMYSSKNSTPAAVQAWIAEGQK
jgi:hypothetical protein